MRRHLVLVLLTAASVAALPAHADRGGHGGHGFGGGPGHRGGPPSGVHYDRGDHGSRGGHRNHDSAWAGLAVVGALAGLAYIAAANPRPVVTQRYYAEPAYPVYSSAPAYVAPPPSAGTWYFCQSSGIYYPYTRACPEGWMAVPARPY